MGSIRLFALGFFQNNDPVDLDPVDLDPELPIHLTGHPSKDHSAGPMVGRKKPFRIEYPLLVCVRSLFLTRYLRSTLNEVSGVTPKADSQGPVKCPVKSARVESAHGRPMKRLQERHSQATGALGLGLCWLMFALTVLKYMDRQAIALVGPQIKAQFALDNQGVWLGSGGVSAQLYLLPVAGRLSG